MKNVRLLSLVNNKLMVISDSIINFYILQKSDLVLKRSMKSIKEVVGIGYTDGNIYIKDKKNIYILSE